MVDFSIFDVMQPCLLVGGDRTVDKPSLFRHSNLILTDGILNSKNEDSMSLLTSVTPIQKLKSSQVGRCASLNQLRQHLENCIYPGKSAGPPLKARLSYLCCTPRHLDSAVGMLSDPEPSFKLMFT